eukprot:GHVO01005053.1.p2 GENE.GHVO01005053.1~~GHVO01005053.1.p2  ORF type:complete len:222 (-),score=62.91 GHVO01005053.1:427-1092(-)
MTVKVASAMIIHTWMIVEGPMTGRDIRENVNEGGNGEGKEGVKEEGIIGAPPPTPAVSPMAVPAPPTTPPPWDTILMGTMMMCMGGDTARDRRVTRAAKGSTIDTDHTPNDMKWGVPESHHPPPGTVIEGGIWDHPLGRKGSMGIRDRENDAPPPNFPPPTSAAGNLTPPAVACRGHCPPATTKPPKMMDSNTVHTYSFSTCRLSSKANSQQTSNTTRTSS